MANILSKEEFVKVIKAIQKHINYYDALDDINREYDCDGYFTAPDLVTPIIDVLNKMFELPVYRYVGSDIDYFVYELAFGRNPDDLYIEEDGKKITLSTPEELYDWITRPKN